jgi:dimethylaniline monooxygenase (N-oxide forming)
MSQEAFQSAPSEPAPSGRLPRACVIGAGSSGIAAVKALKDRSIPFDCFEKSDQIGGNWVLGNRNGMSSSYSTLHINTSRERMEYADFPMPKSYPDFPRHDQIARYFNDYVDHFELRERITFQVGVQHVERTIAGSWEVTLDTGERRLYEALLLANGHHWDPRWPEPPIPGGFDGEAIHSHDYTDPEQLAGRRVLVVGMGNSALDIAVDASYHAASTTLIARKGVHIVPKYILGRPLDAGVRPSRFPFPWMLLGMQLLLRVTVGPMERYGLPEPDHRLGRVHPAVSSRILDRLAHGAITVRPEIARLEGDRVRFSDGTEQQADLIVYCTGYKITFPFFDESLFAAPENRLMLYKRVFSPELRGLYLIGFVQPWGAIMPIAEAQSRIVSEHLRGTYALPSTAQMRHDIERMLRRQRRRYLPSKRHTIQVDFSNYMVELDDELRAGGARARAAGFRIEVQPPEQLRPPERVVVSRV